MLYTVSKSVPKPEFLAAAGTTYGGIKERAFYLRYVVALFRIAEASPDAPGVIVAGTKVHVTTDWE